MMYVGIIIKENSVVDIMGYSNEDEMRANLNDSPKKGHKQMWRLEDDGDAQEVF